MSIARDSITTSVPKITVGTKSKRSDRTDTSSMITLKPIEVGMTQTLRNRKGLASIGTWHSPELKLRVKSRSATSKNDSAEPINSTGVAKSGHPLMLDPKAIQQALSWPYPYYEQKRRFRLYYK